VTHASVARNRSEDSLHFPLIVNVLRKDVLVERVAGGAMDEEEIVFEKRRRPLEQESPTPLVLLIEIG
jgi:hypothetical protein